MVEDKYINIYIVWILFRNFISTCGNPVGILWEFPHVGILWEFPHVGILWESYGNSHRNPVGMGWEWE